MNPSDDGDSGKSDSEECATLALPAREKLDFRVVVPSCSLAQEGSWHLQLVMLEDGDPVMHRELVPVLVTS